MGKVIGITIFVVFVFVAGYLTASWRFVYSTTYVLTEPLSIKNSQGSGELPIGTELHYQSMAHGEVDFYTFIRVAREEAMAKTKEVEVDTYNGIKRLKSSAE
ncbi:MULTISPECIES: hypothetical protein [unclassified Alteromonas]|uniref:hypothetical protein n=1 Tax=unclassified Alteromonas TaxID=2614992 RepID=UPI001EF3C3ED|nr:MULTISPECIES: hypothetical protein [unclassified Alteromonas]MCG7639834.1 hypothetical protein [Alteromonas sp. CNT1-28]MCG7815086.1 hypothetical protein [Alteromonas sp. MCA-1]